MIKLPPEYSQILAAHDATLLERVTQAQDAPFEEELQLLLKLRLARQVFADRLELYLSIRKTDRLEVRAMAAEGLHKAIVDYVTLAERIVALDAKISDHISIHTVMTIVQQIKRIAKRELDHVDPAVAGRLVDALDEEIRVPSARDRNSGVEFTPADQLVHAMDTTIPAYACLERN